MSNSFSDVKRIICNSYIFFFERCFRKRLTFLLDNNIISMLKRKALSYVALAQLDRASGYGPEGQGFESLMLRQQNPTQTSWAFVFLCCASKSLLVKRCESRPYFRCQLFTRPDLRSGCTRLTFGSNRC